MILRWPGSVSIWVMEADRQRIRTHLSAKRETKPNSGLKRPLTEKSAFFWILGLFSFYSTAAEPQLCCILLRNYSAGHGNLGGGSWFVTISVVVLSSAPVCVFVVCVHVCWLPALYTEPLLFIGKVRPSLPTDWSKFSDVLWENSSRLKTSWMLLGGRGGGTR